MGFEIPEDVAAAESVPEDLNANLVGPYRFPSPRRRRLAAAVYLFGAVVSAVTALVVGPVVLWWVALGFSALAAWNVSSAWDVSLHEDEVFDAAAEAVGFEVGHASAAMQFVGLRSVPVWRVILYSADEPPSKRALVPIDGRSAELFAEPYVEDLSPIGR